MMMRSKGGFLLLFLILSLNLTSTLVYCRAPFAVSNSAGVSRQLSFVPRGGVLESDYDASDFDESNDEDDGESDDTDLAPPRRQEQSRPRRLPKRKKKKSLFQSVAETSLKLTTKTALATAKQSGKAAYFLVKPKHVDKQELMGLWRLDQQVVLDEDRSAVPRECHANMELTPRSLRLTNEAGETWDGPWTFRPSQWPRAAQVEFRAPAFFGLPETFRYKGHVDRKLAARSVLKIRGKIYRVEKTGWRGKTVQYVPVGTFVARRRLRVDEEESDWDEDENDGWESEEEEDWQSDDGGDDDNGGDDSGDEDDDDDYDDWGDEEL